MASRISGTVLAVKTMCIVSVSVAGAPRRCIGGQNGPITPMAISRAAVMRKLRFPRAAPQTPAPNASRSTVSSRPSATHTGRDGASMADSSLMV